MKIQILLPFVALLLVWRGTPDAAVTENSDPELAPRPVGPQLAGDRFLPRVQASVYETGTGPFVAINEAH